MKRRPTMVQVELVTDDGLEVVETSADTDAAVKWIRTHGDDDTQYRIVRVLMSLKVTRIQLEKITVEEVDR